jgi:predicted GNAT superfamily acetyltransferase
MEGTTSRLEVAELHDVHEFQAMELVFESVWERPSQPLVTTELLRALSHADNYVAGAREDGSLVGGLVGFWGRRNGEWCLHSHVLGVAPRAQAHGIGYRLKQHQRTWTLAHGASTVYWTFDPLVRRNAYFNLSKLGAEAVEYHVDFYGPMTDSINGNDETDRILVAWRLDSERVTAAAEGSLPEVDLDSLRSAGARVALAADNAGHPVRYPPSGDVILCEVPPDIVSLRHARPERAREWRLALRETLGRALREGGIVRTMTRSGWYVVERGRRSGE